MISHIFEFLKLEDKKSAATVCWSWYYASIQPRFLKKEVIRLQDRKKIPDVLKIFTNSLLPYFAFRIYDLGLIVYEDVPITETYKKALVSFEAEKKRFEFVHTIWPLLASKVVYLEFVNAVEFYYETLPGLLNPTQQLKVLKICGIQYSHEKVLEKVNRLQSLEELVLENVHSLRLNKEKLLKIIPETLRKLCVKSMWRSEFIIKDLSNVIQFCSSHLESLELFDVNLTFEVMQSIVNLNLKLKKFELYLRNSMYHINDPEIILLLLKTQWPLVDLKLCANCLTYENVFAIMNTFKDLEHLTVSSLSEGAFETMAGISGSSFEALSRLTNLIDSLTKLKSLYVGVQR